MEPVSPAAPPTAAERPRSWRRPARRWIYAAIAVAFWIHALFGGEGLVTQYRRHERLVELERRVAAEQRLNERLAREVAALRDDDLAIEGAVRDQLDYQRPGELVLIVEDPDPLARR